MDYQKIYNQLIDRAKNRLLEGYRECHHIIPRCIGGMNTAENLVDLTPEEHYVAHQLLVKIYPDNDKLIYAAIMMCANRPGNKPYAWIKRRLSHAVKKRLAGDKHPAFGTMWITNGVNNRKIQNDESIPRGWRKGRTCKSGVLIAINDGQKYRMISKDQIIPIGWKLGGLQYPRKNNMRIRKRKQFIAICPKCNKIFTSWTKKIFCSYNCSNARSGINHCNFGKHWINNGKDRRFFSKKDPLPIGWKVGYRLTDTKSKNEIFGCNPNLDGESPSVSSTLNNR